MVHWEGWGGQRGQNRRQKQHEQQQVSFNNISFCTIRHKKINTFPFKLQSESFLVFGTAVEMRLHVLDAAGLWWEVWMKSFVAVYGSNRMFCYVYDPGLLSTWQILWMLTLTLAAKSVLSQKSLFWQWKGSRGVHVTKNWFYGGCFPVWWTCRSAASSSSRNPGILQLRHRPDLQAYT